MKLSTKIKLKLAKTANVKLAEFKSGDITFYTLEEETLAENVEVFVMDEEGAYVLPEDGVYPIDGQNVTIEKGIIVKMEPITGDEGGGEGDEGGAGTLRSKLIKLEEGAEVTVEDYNNLIEVVETIIEAVDDLGGEVEENAEELKLSKAEAAAAKTEATAAKTEASSAKAELKLALQKSNGKFVNPNPSQKPDGDGKKSGSDVLKKFGL